MLRVTKDRKRKYVSLGISVNPENKINGFDVRMAVRPFAYIDSILFGRAEIAFFTE